MAEYTVPTGAAQAVLAVASCFGNLRLPPKGDLSQSGKLEQHGILWEGLDRGLWRRLTAQ